MAEDRPEVSPRPRRRKAGSEGGDRLVADQVAEERRLGEDLQTQERRARLERDALQFLAAVKLDRREDVAHRHAEQEPPARRAQPAGQTPAKAHGASAEHVVALVDGLEQGIEMGPRPDLVRERDESERERRTRQAFLDRTVPAARGVDDPRLGRTPTRGEQARQRHADRLGPAEVVAAEHDHADARAQERVALDVRFQRVDELITHGHSGLQGGRGGQGASGRLSRRATARPPADRPPGAAERRGRGVRLRSVSRQPERSARPRWTCRGERPRPPRPVRAP